MSRGALRFSCAARSVVDAAAVLSSDPARALVIGAVQRRRVRIDDVSHWIEARRPNGRRALREILKEAAAGAWSLPEAGLARLVATSRVLPPAWLNPELRDADGRRLTTPDLWLDDVAMAVLVHSRQFHARRPGLGLHGRAGLRPVRCAGRRHRGHAHGARPQP